MAQVIIGANWGDEGKGLLTDFYATPKSMVVRFNGGAQAGHTVCRDGRRHVFHHFGSGSLKGASTYLSRFFISNPILFFRELNVLNGIGVDPLVAVDAAGLITTPFDMMINQIVEQARGNARHGSCGVGINETVKRTEAGYAITIADLAGPLRDTLCDIRREWLPVRLAQLDVVPDQEWQDRLASDAIMDAFIEHCEAYRRYIRVCALGECGRDVVFEGAQGLLLDEDHRFFPYVTHSHTGLRNVVALVSEAGITDLSVIYVTRAYATRHGAGPFPREVAGLRYEDATNLPNDWQGSLRFGRLDLDLLKETIDNDLKNAASVCYGVAVTCLDQVGDHVSYWRAGSERSDTRSDLLRSARELLGGAFTLASFGPKASDVTSVCAPSFASLTS